MNLPAKGPLRLATRGSALAMWQSRFIQSLLQELGIESELVVIKTEGDRVQDRFLHEIGGKGLFVKELEQALACGKADLAMHSLKDMPAKIPAPFCLAAILERHAPTDVMIAGKHLSAKMGGHERGPVTVEEVSQFGKLRLATASLRRTSLLRRYAPQIETFGIRGNVDTRIRKLHEEGFDALILAEASIDRLSIKSEVYRTLAPSWFIPSPGQGALAIEMLEDHPSRPLIAQLDHQATHAAVAIERKVLQDLGGDCTMPFGCHVGQGSNGLCEARATILDYDGNAASCHLTQMPFAPELADTIFQALMADGAAAILQKIRTTKPTI